MVQIREAKVKRRRLERKAVKSGNHRDAIAYRDQVKYVNSLCNEARKKHIKDNIYNSKDDKKKLFKTANSLLKEQSESKSPQDVALHLLPNYFSRFFRDKIITVTFIQISNLNH